MEEKLNDVQDAAYWIMKEAMDKMSNGTLLPALRAVLLNRCRKKQSKPKVALLMTALLGVFKADAE